MPRYRKPNQRRIQLSDAALNAGGVLMPFQIKHRWTGAVLFESESATTLREAVLAAVAAWADLAGANLTRADLTGADLAGADLTRANLTRANLIWADLDPIKSDIWMILTLARSEVAGLLAALKEGRVDGSCYEGECACLLGTIANVKGCSHNLLPGLLPNADRAAERWFLAIQKGDTPETNPIAKLTVEWIEEWQSLQPDFLAEVQA